MRESILDHWGVMLLRGALALVVGVLAFAAPAVTLFAIVIAFGAYAIVDGISAIIMGVSKSRSGGSFAALALLGVVSVLAGVVALSWPGITAVALLFTIAAWSVVRGVFEIAAAIRLRKEIEHEWLLGLAGVSSIIFGVLLILWPGIGLLTLTLLAGAYAFVAGILEIGLAFRMRRIKEQLRREYPESPGASPQHV